MIEAIIIVCIILACRYMPLRGKTFNTLTPKHQMLVQKEYSHYMRTKKGKQNPNMKVEEYLPILQQQALSFLYVAIVVIPIYIIAIVAIYSKLLS